MSDYLHGVCHPGRRHYSDLRNAGINAVRTDIPFPFSDAGGGISEKFQTTSEWIREMRAEGFVVIGITPYPHAIPEWEGAIASDEWFGTVRRACAFLGEHFGDDIPIWQCTNEMNLDGFRQPLDPDQALTFLRESGRGIKDASTSLQAGVNMGGFNDLAVDMYRAVYGPESHADIVPWDYVGTDGYFGTWERGSPRTWIEKTDLLAEITPLPVIVMEWGYSSAGRILPPEEVIENAIDSHEVQAWCWGWEMPDGEVRPHDPATQARYIEETIPILRERTIGQMYYCRGDSDRCSCGEVSCPVEAKWGLFNPRGEPKPSYFAMGRAIRALE